MKKSIISKIATLIAVICFSICMQTFVYANTTANEIKIETANLTNKSSIKKGEALKLAHKLIKSKKIKSNLKKAFKWSAKMKYNAVAIPKTKKEKQIAEYYGQLGLQFKRGDCYTQAYTFYWLAKALGYDAKVIRGYIQKSNGLSKHAWCEIKKKGKKYVCDPNFNAEYSTKLKNSNAGYMFKYGDKSTLKYYSAKKKMLTK